MILYLNIVSHCSFCLHFQESSVSFNLIGYVHTAFLNLLNGKVGKMKSVRVLDVVFFNNFLIKLIGRNLFSDLFTKRTVGKQDCSCKLVKS